MRERIGRYWLGQRIASGGMAEVFAGEIAGAEGFGREVAIKRVLPAVSGAPEFGRLFVREARIASLLTHPNIVSVLDFDRDARGRYYLVMERIRGVDVSALMNTGPVPVGVAVFIVAEMLAGLAHAHELTHEGQPLGVVHRDISPHNVMLSFGGEVKLVDFGIARTLSAARASLAGSIPGQMKNAPVIRGKIAYMSPEQLHGVELDGRTDVFSAGVILHELLTGHRLFAGRTPEHSMELVLRKKLPGPSSFQPAVPHALDAVCMHMLTRDRKQRLASARAARAALFHASGTNPADSAHMHRMSREGLSELLHERFPDRQPYRVPEPYVQLSQKTVPVQPSVTIEPAGDTLVLNAPTRPAPPVAPSPLLESTPAYEPEPRLIRVARWIMIAILLSLAIIAATVYISSF